MKLEEVIEELIILPKGVLNNLYSFLNIATREVKENGMDGTCRTNGEDENYKILLRNLESRGYCENPDECDKISRCKD